MIPTAYPARPERFKIERAPGVVRLWVDAPIRFEPRTPAEMTLRKELFLACRELRARDEEVLAAVLRTAAPFLSDVENVLFYNVGPGTFARSTGRGLRFERDTRRAEAAPFETESSYEHTYRVEPLSSAFPTRWTPLEDRAAWHDAAIGPIHRTSKPSRVWHAIRACPTLRSSGRLPDSARFGLRLRLNVPVGVALDGAGLVKALFDGVIASFSLHQPRSAEELRHVAAAIADQTSSLDRNSVARQLIENDHAVLGTRRVVQPYRGHALWNPDDMRCVAGELVIDRGTDTWGLTGTLFEVAARS